MADEPRARAPDKRERRPGQEAAFLEKMGKVTQSHDATNDVALSPRIDILDHLAAALPIGGRA
jgi:hypothetical protein